MISNNTSFLNQCQKVRIRVLQKEGCANRQIRGGVKWPRWRWSSGRNVRKMCYTPTVGLE